jgi:hypothetical protein
MGKSFVDFSTSMLIQSSVLIVVLLALDLLLRKKVRAIFRYCIWMLVLVVAGLCVAGCTVGMSTKTSPKGHGPMADWCGESFKPVLAIVGPRGGGLSGNETARVLIRHADGAYYVIDMDTTHARKVEQVKPCNPCGN